MLYLNSITLVGSLVLTRSNVKRKATVEIHRAVHRTQRSWKNADENGARKPSGSGRCVPATFGRAGSTTIKKGATIVEGSSARPRTKTAKGKVEDLEVTSWSVRADVVAARSREPEPNRPSPQSGVHEAL